MQPIILMTEHAEEELSFFFELVEQRDRERVLDRRDTKHLDMGTNQLLLLEL